MFFLLFSFLPVTPPRGFQRCIAPAAIFDMPPTPITASSPKFCGLYHPICLLSVAAPLLAGAATHAALLSQNNPRKSRQCDWKKNKKMKINEMNKIRIFPHPTSHSGWDPKPSLPDICLRPLGCDGRASRPAGLLPRQTTALQPCQYCSFLFCFFWWGGGGG